MESLEALSSFTNWTRPDLNKEKGELKRVAREFLGREDAVKELRDSLERSNVVELSESDWESLENTDSFHNVRFGSIDDARKITEEYNMLLDEDSRRDFDALLEGFTENKEMQCPTIVKKGGKMHLISGNTRLMISRALGIRPKVIIVEL